MSASETSADATGNPPARQPAIDLRNVTVVRGGRPILDRVTWSVPAGSVAAVLGPNGSGKSTLVRVVMGHLWPTAGTVSVLGQPFGRTDLNALRQRVRLVQTGGTVEIDSAETAERVVLTGCFGTVGLYATPTAEQRDRARSLVAAVGLSVEAQQPYGTLSNGERMRCLIARALVVRPELLILDEPTAGLDLVARERVLATVARLARGGPAVVVITHHTEELLPETASVLVLKEGTAAAVGRPADVLTSAVLSDVYGVPVDVAERGGRFWLHVRSSAWNLLQGGHRPPT